METGKKAVGTVKEVTANVAASAKSGMDKTKATVQEKVDKMKAKDDYEKAVATEVKDQRITEAELNKQQAMSHNAAEKDARATEAEAHHGGEAVLHKQHDMDHDAAEKDAKAAVAAETHGAHEAELHKQQHAMSHDAAERDAKAAVAEVIGTGVGIGGICNSETGTGTTGPQYLHLTTGATGHPTGAHQMSAMPGHGTSEPLGGHIVEGTQVGSHPIGKATGTNTRTTTAQNRHVGGGTRPGYTGTGYSG